MFKKILASIVISIICLTLMEGVMGAVAYAAGTGMPAAPPISVPGPSADATAVGGPSGASGSEATSMPIIPSINSLPGSNLGKMKTGDAVVGELTGSVIPYFIKGFLVFVGVSALLFTIIGGIQFVLSLGNEEAAGQAKKAIMYALLGLVVALLSFAIVSIISSSSSVLDKPAPSAPAPTSFFIESAYAAGTAPSPAPVADKVKSLDLLPDQSELFGTSENAPRLVGQKGENLVRDIAPKIIQLILALGGVVVFVVFVITGIRLVMAGDNEEELGEIKSTFTYSLIGLLVIAGSYAIIFGIMKIFSNL